MVNCPAIQFKFSPQNALQSRPRYAKIGRSEQNDINEQEAAHDIAR